MYNHYCATQHFIFQVGKYSFLVNSYKNQWRQGSNISIQRMLQFDWKKILFSLGHGSQYLLLIVEAIRHLNLVNSKCILIRFCQLDNLATSYYSIGFELLVAVVDTCFKQNFSWHNACMHMVHFLPFLHSRMNSIKCTKP